LKHAFFVVVVGLVACKSSPAASAVCAKLEADGVAQGCKAEPPGGIGAAASERFTFTVPGRPGRAAPVRLAGRADLRAAQRGHAGSSRGEDAYDRRSTVKGPNR
jgi:hypothetical protein